LDHQSCGEGDEEEPSPQLACWTLALGSGATMALPHAGQGLVRVGMGVHPMAVVGLDPVSSFTSIVRLLLGSRRGMGFPGLGQAVAFLCIWG